ncbi:unnamed protein product [Ceutorhynchus assimilis]|uniref:Hamartin n=1 Tax=Ceutorhynchus assimilis TaxID=467358 RepID=A0A9N9MTA0_9CUCU|nr:unnamed protein product [Ceutorhynchus assimilis]
MSYHHHEHVFDKLESNNKEIVEKFKHSIHEQYSRVQEPWLINGLYDYYLNTNSVRCMEVLINLREPHQNFLFDRLCDSIRNSKNEVKVRIQAFTLLGHIAKSQPVWLYKLPSHPLFREILRFLINESELLPLVSALLVLIVLLPMFPSAIGENYLEGVFDIFRRLAAWNSNVPSKSVEDQMIHLQVALYALFLRLYGMYPCNFLSYLQNHFKDRSNPVFCHTIKPMMDTVKMHPSLVTTSKDLETTTERWKKMKVHDVIVECERFSLDITDRCPHETCQNTTEFRSRSGTMNSTMGSATTNNSEFIYPQQHVKSLATSQMSGAEAFFSPSQLFHIQTPPISESTGVSHRPVQGINRSNYTMSQEGSPPEAAIEATPETTPIRDFNAPPAVAASAKNSVARALTSFRNNSSSTIVSGTPANSVPSSPMRKEPSPFVFPSAAPNSATLSQNLVYRMKQELQRHHQQQALDSQQTSSKPVPSSPLKIINPDNRHRVDSPVSQEDEEVSLISVSAGKLDTPKKRLATLSDSSAPDLEDSDCNKESDDIEHGSPCTAGGLHMPNSKSINNFKKRIRRFRKHSQCTEQELRETSTGSSPGNGVAFTSNSVRRANSYPDVKKSPHVPSKPFYETDEETVSEDQVSNISNGVDAKSKNSKSSTQTQTDVFWPMPYEHLFLNIFPSLKEDSIEIKASPAPSPAPVFNQMIEPCKPSLYDILDKYIEKCVATSDSNSLRDQLQLVHQQLYFERHRRETHAYRNRTLLSDAKSTRLLEECNSALRDQVQLKQREIEDSRKQLEDYRNEILNSQGRLESTVQYLQHKCQILSDENGSLQEANSKLDSEVTEYKHKCNSIDKDRQQAEAALLDALAEGKVAKEQALVGEKVKLELQRVNRQILLMGEMHVQYRERLEKLPSTRQCDEEMRQISEAYREELNALQYSLEAKTVTIEAYKSRILELEQTISNKDDIISAQKRTLASANEAREALLEAVESKYQTQLAINRTLEERMLELRHKLEVEAARRRTHSPDTSSCHEVQASTSTATTAAAGLSPQHSSPLSTSLASSEGSAAMQELRNLQMFVDQEGSSNEATGLGKND